MVKPNLKTEGVVMYSSFTAMCFAHAHQLADILTVVAAVPEELLHASHYLLCSSSYRRRCNDASIL